VYSQQGSFYRVTKEVVESLLEAYHNPFGLEYTILRYDSLYGPKTQDWNGLKRCVVQAFKEGRIVYPGSGEECREYIHARNVAQLGIQALSPEFANQYLTITGTHILSTKDAMYMIREITGHVEFSPLVDHDYEIFSLLPHPLSIYTTSSKESRSK
jgi:UDP-glucose 4-epimerase